MNASVLERLKRWRESPLLFVTECLKAKPSSQQAEALVAMTKGKRLSIRSGHGTGKSALAAWRILHFMATRAYPKVVCTAPTARQLSDVLWSELSKWLRGSILADEFILQNDKIFHKDAPKEWWARAVSPSVKASKEEQAETLAGFHGEHLLIIVDESSGVEDPVFIPLEGALTQEDNHVMLIGNPTRNTGYFYDTHFHPEISKKWIKLHWDSRFSENVTKEMVDYFREKYGEDSNVFRIRVMGEPPVDDDRSFIPLHWALQCVGREIEVDEEWPLSLSVDVAREGEDLSVIMPRRGFKIYEWDTFQGMHTIELGQRIVEKFFDMDASYVGVDTVGIGGGVYDWLSHDPRGLGAQVMFSVNVAEKAGEREKYYRLRDELWGLVRKNCMEAKYSFPNFVVRKQGIEMNIGHELANELASVGYKVGTGGEIKIESKADLKKRGVKSPNLADSLCISEYIHGLAFQQWKSSEKVKMFRRKRDGLDLMGKTYSWMVA